MFRNDLLSRLRRGRLGALAWSSGPIMSLVSGRIGSIGPKSLLRGLCSCPPRGQRVFYGAELPPGVSQEEAISTVQEVWGKKLATGIADKAGLKGKSREDFIQSWSRVVAEGLVRG